jgi:transposase-like protein
LYRALDSTGETVDVMLSHKAGRHRRQRLPAKRALATGQIRPRVINVDGHASYPPAIAELKASGELSRILPLSAGALSQ